MQVILFDLKPGVLFFFGQPKCNLRPACNSGFKQKGEKQCNYSYRAERSKIKDLDSAGRLMKGCVLNTSDSQHFNIRHSLESPFKI